MRQNSSRLAFIFHCSDHENDHKSFLFTISLVHVKGFLPSWMGVLFRGHIKMNSGFIHVVHMGHGIIVRIPQRDHKSLEGKQLLFLVWGKLCLMLVLKYMLIGNNIS